jgi:hypothetical protein
MKSIVTLTLACGLLLQAPAFAADEPEPEPAPLDLSTLNWRHGQLQLHQALGLSTLGAMAATGGFGYWLSRQGGNSGVFDAHLLLAGMTTGLYLTSATLALTAPPRPLTGEPEGPWDTTSLHRNIGWLHAAGMAGTVGMGLLATYNSLSYSQYHAIAGYTTIGLMALSAGVIAFWE